MDLPSMAATAKLKRPRVIQVPSFDAAELVANLQKALTSKQRLLAVHQIRTIVENAPDPAEASSWLINSGLFRTAHLQLRYVIQRHGSVQKELEEVANLLIVLLRNTSASSIQSELEDDYNASGPHLVDILSNLFVWGLQSEMVCILHILSSHVVGSRMILGCRPVLHRLVDVLKRLDTDTTVLLEALSTLKNVTFRTEEDKRVLLDVPDLVPTLTALNNTGVDILSAIWRNLSLSIDVRRRLAHFPNILNSLLFLTNGDTEYVVRNALNTLISMSMEADSCLLLVCHGDGSFIDAVKDLQQSSDCVIRKRSARVLKLWASNDLSGPILIHDSSLTALLSRQALCDDNAHVRQEAGEAFCRCSQLIQSPMPQHEAVLDALLYLARTSALPVEVMARTLRAQASHEDNRIPMAEKKLLLVLLAHVANTSVSNPAREDACCALADLSSEPTNLESLSITPVLEAVVRNTLDSQGPCRDYAVLCFVRLSLFKQRNREKFAARADLLQSLLQYAATSRHTTTKTQVKKAILLLISEL